MRNRKILNKKDTLAGLLIAIVLLMAIGFLLMCKAQHHAFAIEENLSGQTEEKILSTATIENDFTDNILLVSLTQIATLRFKQYTIADFPELKLVSVTEMTENLASRAEQQVRNEAWGITIGNARRIDIGSFRRILKLELAEIGKKNILEAIKILETREDVRSAEPDYIGEFSTLVPNDPHRGDQWAINYLQLPDAWHLSTGSANVRVGIADSGIDRNHPDLAGRINEDLSRDHTGGGNPWIAGNVHGTHVAGIVGAIGNNATPTGVVGVNWNVELVSLKVGNDGPTSAAVAAAIFHAEANDIRVVNLSLSVGETTAINDAINAFDGVIVCAAGNNNSDTVGYPARVNNLRIISVGSLDSDGSRSSFSNWGKVELWAPGGNILSTIPTGTTPAGYRRHSNGYAYTDGTSMATPYVAGVAALMLSINPDLTPQQLRANLISNSNAITITIPDPGFWPWEWDRTKERSVDKLNAYEAVKSVAIFDTKVLTDDTIEIVGTFDRQLSGNIEIPSTLNNRIVTAIGDEAFINQAYLSSVIVPSTVVTIGDSSFKYCFNLYSVVFGFSSRLISIGDHAFYSTGLTSIIIPRMVVNIGNGTFANCFSLKNVFFGPNSQLYSIGSNAFTNSPSLSSIALPNNMTIIGTRAFSSSGLVDVILPSSIEEIGKGAFNDCNTLTNITLPFVGSFYRDTDRYLGHIFGAPNYDVQQSYIPSSLKTVVVTSDNDITNNAFYNCTSLTSITIPDSVTSIGNNAFYNCNSLINITIPNSVTSIGYNAFYGCDSLENITIPFIGDKLDEGVDGKHLGYIFGALNYDVQQSYIPSSLKTVVVTNDNDITNNAFYNCSNLTNITIPGSVESVAANAFSGCNPELAITWHYNESNELIADNFSKYLIKVVMPEGTTRIRPYAFQNASRLTEVTIPDSVIDIENSAFFKCTNLSSVHISKGITNIGKYAFAYCPNIVNISASIYNTTFKSEDNCLIRKSDNALIIGCQYSVIPEYIEIIGEGAFLGSNKLENISIPASVTEIGTSAFGACHSLEAVEFAKNNNLITIGENAFTYCTNLKNIIIPKGVREINRSTFSNAGLQNIVFEDSSQLDYIGPSAFYACFYLSSIKIPSSVTSIGVSAFRNCFSLTEVVFENNSNLETIEGGAFADTGISDITLPNSVSFIGHIAFSNTPLVSVTLPESIDIIDDGAFRSCYNLAVVCIEKSVENSIISFGSDVFYDCDNLFLIILPDFATLLEYQYSSNISEFADIMHCIKLDSIMITDLDYNGFSYDYPPFNRFSTIYTIDEVISPYFDQGILYEAEDYEIVFYITADILRINDFMDCYDLTMPYTIITFNGISTEELYGSNIVLKQDLYSRGFNIAAEYINALTEQESRCGLSVVWEIYEQIGYFPVIAPSYYCDIFFLRGMSDVFGVPIKVISEAYNINYEMRRTENWLIVGIDNSYFAREIMWMLNTHNNPWTNFYFFGYSWEDLLSFKTYGDNLYLIADKVDCFEEFAFAQLNANTINFNDWIFDAESKWAEMDCCFEQETVNEWVDLWDNLGYVLNFDIWDDYWEEYWEHNNIYMIEQVVFDIYGVEM